MRSLDQLKRLKAEMLCVLMDPNVKRVLNAMIAASESTDDICQQVHMALTSLALTDSPVMQAVRLYIEKKRLLTLDQQPHMVE